MTEGEITQVAGNVQHIATTQPRRGGYHPPAHIAGGINVFRMTELPLSLPQSASLTAPSSDGASFLLKCNTIVLLRNILHPTTFRAISRRPPLRCKFGVFVTFLITYNVFFVCRDTRPRVSANVDDSHSFLITYNVNSRRRGRVPLCPQP